MIRGKLRGCPFGLSIPYGCKSAGSCISHMSVVDEDGEEGDEIIKENKRIMFVCSRDFDEDEKRCPFADLIINSKDGDSVSVDCKFSEEGHDIPAGNVGLTGSPLYPRYYVGDMFQPLKGLPMEYIMDDNQSKNYFGSIYTDLIKHLV